MKPTAILAEWYAALPTDRQQTIAQHDAAPNLSLNLQGGKRRIRFICDCLFFTSMTGQHRLPCTPTHVVYQLLRSCGGGVSISHPPVAGLTSSFP